MFADSFLHYPSSDNREITFFAWASLHKLIMTQDALASSRTEFKLTHYQKSCGIFRDSPRFRGGQATGLCYAGCVVKSDAERTTPLCTVRRVAIGALLVLRRPCCRAEQFIR